MLEMENDTQIVNSYGKIKKSKTEKNFRAMKCRQSGFCEFDI